MAQVKKFLSNISHEDGPNVGAVMFKTTKVPTTQPTTLESTIIIRLEAESLGPEFYLDVFYAETQSGIPILNSLSLVLETIQRERMLMGVSA